MSALTEREDGFTDGYESGFENGYTAGHRAAEEQMANRLSGTDTTFASRQRVLTKLLAKQLCNLCGHPDPDEIEELVRMALQSTGIILSRLSTRLPDTISVDVPMPEPKNQDDDDAVNPVVIETLSNLAGLLGTEYLCEQLNKYMDNTF